MEDLSPSASHTATPTWRPEPDTSAGAAVAAAAARLGGAVFGAFGGDAICFSLLLSPLETGVGAAAAAAGGLT